MTLDDRMQAAFNDRTHSLETTMTTPTLEAPSAASGTTMFATFGPWIAGVAAVAALVFGANALRGGGDTSVVVTDQPTTTEADGSVDESSVASSSPSTTAQTETPIVPTTASEGQTPTTVAGGTSNTIAASAASCSATGYSVTLPTGWYHDGCQLFSPAAIPAPGPFEYRPEIRLSYMTDQDYARALFRINSSLTVLSSSATTIDGLDATIFVIEEEWFDIGERTIVVVDGGAGVFFASGDELVDSGAVFADRDAHYASTLLALDEMMAAVDLTYLEPVTQLPPPCIAPTLVNALAGPSIQADIDGDGQMDTVDMIHHDAGVSLVVSAGATGAFSGSFVTSDLPHVSNEIIAVDLDADGVMEILASAQAGAAANSYELFFLSGCDLVPVTGATPALIQRASVTNANSFECNFGAHGKVQLDTNESVYNNASGNFDHSGATFQFDGSSWTSLATTASTSPDPIQLTGPTSCG